jgi:hypothetical protein
MVKSFTGYRASRKEPVPITDVDQHDAVSILSLPTNRSERIKMIDGWKETRKKKKNEISSADSVLSDITFSTTRTVSKEISCPSICKQSTHDFILECDNGERIYVPSMQGMVIKSRCRHLMLTLETNRTNNLSWGGSDFDSVSREHEHRIITKEKWALRTARHIIELLAEGITWIENDQNRFVELLRACDEINVRLHLGSPINHHDVLDPASSLRFFKLVDDQNYRFQLAGRIKSCEWIYLIQKGILLHLNSTVLMLSATPSAERSEDSNARQQRLSKCDDLYSEFSVYSNRSTINALYTILGVLSSNETNSKKEKGFSGSRSATEESIQIVCKTVSGGLSERDLNMLWRMTSSSYTLSTPEEQRLLQSDETQYPAEHRRKNPPMGDIRICKDPSADSSENTALTDTSESTETTHRECNQDDDGSSHESSSQDSHTYAPPSKPADPPIKHEIRTITGTSFVALKHMFHPVNRSDNCSSAQNRDPSLLPACLSIANPTPDTLGRFLNACAVTPNKISYETTAKIGYDILPSSSSTNGKSGMMFFVSNTSQRVKEILDCMADYSGTSVVGDADFRLEQLRHV